MRGVGFDKESLDADLIAAAGFIAEIGDLRRLSSPRLLMAYLGLVPSEHSTGDKIRRGLFTKAGNGRATALGGRKLRELPTSAADRCRSSAESGTCTTPRA